MGILKNIGEDQPGQYQLDRHAKTGQEEKVDFIDAGSFHDQTDDDEENIYEGKLPQLKLDHSVHCTSPRFSSMIWSANCRVNSSL